MPTTPSVGSAAEGAGGGRRSGTRTGTSTSRRRLPGAWRGGRCRPRGERALAHQEAARTPVTHQRHQLVVGHAAPSREIRLDRDLGGAELEELPALQRIDVLPDQEQEAVAAVEVAPVEAC